MIKPRQTRQGHCGNCHKHTVWVKGKGTAWKIWICAECRSKTRNVTA